MGQDHEKFDLQEIREKIDSLDSSLIDLLRERANLAQAIGEIKGTGGKPFF